MDELKEKIALKIEPKCLAFGLRYSGSGELPAQVAREFAQAALNAIEEAGYVLTPKSDWSKGLEGLPAPVGSRPASYRDDPRSARQIIEEDNWPGHYSDISSDSATSFDPEKTHCKENDL